MRVLIIRFSSIGDIVLTTPVMRCLKVQYPAAEIHYLTKPAFLPILESNPYIFKVHLLKDTLKQTIKDLQSEKFDVVIDLHNNLRTLLIKISLQKKTYSFAKLNFRKWLSTRWKINILPDIHIVDRYLATVQTFGIINDGKGLDYFIPPTEIIDPFAIWNIHPNSYTGLVIGATHATKRLTLPQLKELALKIEGKVILLGGPSDVSAGEAIEAIDPDRIINACGKYTINQSASIVQRARVIITHDTGLMHIAAALQKKIISIWGNTVPSFGMYPYYGIASTPQFIAEVKGLPCRPCSKIGFPSCPKKHFNCMMLQDLGQISKEGGMSYEL